MQASVEVNYSCENFQSGKPTTTVATHYLYKGVCDTEEEPFKMVRNQKVAKCNSNALEDYY